RGAGDGRAGSPGSPGDRLGPAGGPRKGDVVQPPGGTSIGHHALGQGNGARVPGGRARRARVAALPAGDRGDLAGACALSPQTPCARARRSTGCSISTAIPRDAAPARIWRRQPGLAAATTSAPLALTVASLRSR